MKNSAKEVVDKMFAAFNSGDVEKLVETYGVKVDPAIHAEVLERNKQFTSAPYGGFVNPLLVPQMGDNGEVENFTIEQPKTFAEQMLFYSKNYSNLPAVN